MRNAARELRKKDGLRQADLAAMLGVSRQTVIAIENDRYDPSLALAIKIAGLFRMPVEEIFFPDN
ncbi:helix-turn-helix transcriptional regulator [Olsenella sp. HMSC062G07]|uniref:helix-turn-helix transcriptional regulator n=1 Tax=Olsenella sp. HMSC062G07 TaxID=1739330 RepID=UPI0008A1D2E8|nr:helix-turn-helix transcriptional regulator [Olsenella sp. HMSC062G07]OFK22819.1 transcriptional regulator [Olsenella sp. HMSC062G07]